MPPKDMHYNHRYAFNPALRAQLCAGNGQISAETDGIIEAISLSNHPFWHGVQGHPELASRPQAPHPLFCAFYKPCGLRWRNATARVLCQGVHHLAQGCQRTVRNGF
ncbi:hypothetical protein ABC733_23615 [Mangrovibacter sp. SLW1]